MSNKDKDNENEKKIDGANETGINETGANETNAPNTAPDTPEIPILPEELVIPAEDRDYKSRILKILFDNKVTVLFVILCVGAYFASNTTLTFLMPELVTRMGRNTFLVLSLLIPVVAGLGLNFGITIGAISAQIGVFWTVYFGITGFKGILFCLAICTPLAVLFGYLVGRLFNKMKGTEMIGGLILSYFADGLYQFLFLFVIGGVIKLDNPRLLIPGGVGVKNTIDTVGTIKYAIDDVPMISILDVVFYVFIAVSVIAVIVSLVKKRGPVKKYIAAIIGAALIYALSFIPVISAFLSTNRLNLIAAVTICVVCAVGYSLVQIIIIKGVKKSGASINKHIARLAAAVLVYAITYIPAIETAMLAVHIPVLSFSLIAVLCTFNSALMRTRLGQNMRTVGQNRSVANSAGINVDQTRILAMIFSTVLASWGQLISLQNIGTLTTYGAHTNIGQYSIAALLVGGASVHKASNKHAILGVVLFHTLFILAPVAGKVIFQNAQIGEYFRVFVAYGVIALSLAMHAWQAVSKKKKPTAAAADTAVK